MPSPPADHESDGKYQAERVEQLFDEALDLKQESQAAFLEAACGADTHLRRVVEQLLASSAGAQHNPAWLEPALHNIVRTAARTAAGAAEPVLERYRLTERIGSGGMGVVYKAVRSDDVYSQEVAIKIVPWCAGDENVLRRFRTERQILAGLKHPYIARLLDGGATGDGAPFLVMELVEGVPLDQYVAEQKPALNQLLELFRRICDAVGYAHRNLVVHRDLKPGNILVTDSPEGNSAGNSAGNPEPKLLDFGIARLLDDSGEQTRTAMMTIEYASPEQVAGAPIGTASDIYSLGVLLYRMVAGASPYGSTIGAADLTRAITSEDPQPLGASVPEDLDKIIHMALRKEPERRYATVEQLSDDLRRFAEGYPVQARRDTRGYRTRKFVGRNKLAIAAAALLLATLSTGIVATVREARIAQGRFDDARHLANSYLFDTYDAIWQLPGSLPARKLVVNRALEYMDKLSREHDGDAGLARELATAYSRAADVMGQAFYPNLGDSSRALATYQKSLALDAELLAANPRDSATSLQAADSHGKSCQILMLGGDLRAAEQECRRGLAIVEALAPTVTRAREILPTYYWVLAAVEGNPNNPNRGNTALAMELYQKALAEELKVAAAHAGDPAHSMMAAAKYGTVGQMYGALNQGSEAIEALQHSLDISEGLSKSYPTSAYYKRAAAIYNCRVAIIYVEAMNDARRARPFCHRGAQLLDELAQSNPGDMSGFLDSGLGYYAQAMVARDKPAEELTYSDKSIAALQAAMQRSPDGKSPPVLRSAWQLRADALTALGRYPEAIDSAEKELEIDSGLLKASAEDAGAMRNEGMAWAQIGKVHTARREWSEAREFYQRASSMFERQKAEGTLIPSAEKNLVEARAALARCDRELSASISRR